MKTPSLIAFIIGAIFLIAAMAPIPYRYLVSPKDQIYDGTEFWSDDFSAYVSYIIQGQQSKWLVYDTHTAEPNLPGILIHEEYLLWGRLTGIFGLNPVYSYHLFRAVLGTILIALIWKLISEVFSSSATRLTALIFTLFIGGFPSIDSSGKIVSHIPWLTELDIFYRFVSLPHYLLGNIFFLTFLIQFIKLQRTNKFLNLKSLFLILLSGLGAGFTHAVSLVTLYATIGLFFFLTSILDFVIRPKKAISFIIRKSLFLILFVVFTSPILIYFKQLLALPPWNNLSAAWEATTQYYVPPSDVLLAIGPIVFLAPLGFILLLSKKNPLTPLLLASWPISFFLLFYFSHPFLHISQVRFFQSYFFIPLAILSAQAIVALAIRISQLVKLAKSDLFVIFVLLGLVFLSTYPLFQSSFTGRFTFFSDFNYLAYPPKDWADAIYWLGEHTDHNAVVLCAWQCGHHIPFMAGNYVYLGHLWGTLNLNQKLDTAGRFFGGKMSVPEAKKFLADNRIAYVFWGYEERNYGGNPDKYSTIMTPVFSSPAVNIYKSM